MPDTPPVIVHLGPARSGKARLVRDRYRQLVAEVDPALVLVIVPTAQRRAATLDVLLRESSDGMLWHPQVWTFPRYADDLLRRLGTPARRVTPLQRRALMARAVDDRRRAKRIAYFSPILDRPGFLDSLSEFIGRLKDHEVRPEVFSRAVARRSAGLKAVAAIYSRYQAMLAEHRLYDDAGLFWQTRETMAVAPEDFPWPEHVLVDGFQDFAPPQLGMLRALHERGAALTITLPCCRDRPAVFAPTLRTLEHLETTFAGRIEICDTARPGGDAATALVHLERSLLDDGAKGQSPRPPDAVSFVEAAGMLREVECLARKVKRLLQDNPCRSPGDVAVILRSEEPYGQIVAEVFPRYGLPLADVPGKPLNRLPLPRWLLTVLELPINRYRYRDLAAVLRSPYFPRDAFGVGESDLQAADRLLHQLGVFEGAESHLRALRRHASEAEARARREESQAAEETSAEAEAARRVEQLLHALAARLARLPQRGTWGCHAEAVAGLIDEWRLAGIAAGGEDAELIARDLASLEAVRTLLDSMAEMDEWAAEAEMTVAEFAAEFGHGLATTAAQSPQPLGKAVRLLTAQSSRALSFPVVAMPGLNDDLWPGTQRPHMMGVPQNRRTLAEVGLPVTTHDEHMANERFLFYMAATRAAEQLIVSRPASDEDGRPQPASPFWDELLRLTTVGGEGPQVETVTVRDTELPPDDAANLEEVRRLAMGTLSADAKETPNLLAALVQVDPAATATLASVAVERRRESAEPFDRFDGVLSAKEALAQLAARYPAEHVFSITQLENYATCPFRFLALTVLGLRPWEVPQEYFLETQVGELYHEILSGFYRRRRQAGPAGTRLPEIDAETLREEMSAAVQRTFRAREQGGEGGLPALWPIQQEEIAERLLAYLDAETDRCRASPLAVDPRLFEWSFGSARWPDDDPESVDDPLVIDSPHGPVRIRGRIDRIDLLLHREAPYAVAVIDYKSGSRPGGVARSVAEGRALQLPLYLLAAEQALAAKLKARPAQAFYYYLRDLAAFAAIDLLGGDKKAGQHGETLDAARRRVAEILAGVRGGRFPPVPAGECPSWCEFRDLCRTARWRTERKQPEDDSAAD